MFTMKMYENAENEVPCIGVGFRCDKEKFNELTRSYLERTNRISEFTEEQLQNHETCAEIIFNSLLLFPVKNGSGILVCGQLLSEQATVQGIFYQLHQFNPELTKPEIEIIAGRLTI